MGGLNIGRGRTIAASAEGTAGPATWYFSHRYIWRTCTEAACMKLCCRQRKTLTHLYTLYCRGSRAAGRKVLGRHACIATRTLRWIIPGGQLKSIHRISRTRIFTFPRQNDYAATQFLCETKASHLYHHVYRNRNATYSVKPSHYIVLHCHDTETQAAAVPPKSQY